MRVVGALIVLALGHATTAVDVENRDRKLTGAECAEMGFVVNALPCARCEQLAKWLGPDGHEQQLADECVQCCQEKALVRDWALEHALVTALGRERGKERKTNAKLYAKAKMIVDRGRLKTEENEGLASFVEMREEIGPAAGEAKNFKMELKESHTGGSVLLLYTKEGKLVNEYSLERWTYDDITEFLRTMVE